MLWVNSATLNSDFNLLASAKLAGITSNAVLTSNFSLIASITPPILVNAQLNADFNINNVVPKYTARGRGTLTSDFNINNVVPKYTAISRGTLTSNFNLSIVAQLNTMRFVIDTLSGPKSVFLAIDADEPVTILWGDPSGIDTIQSGGVNHVYTASGSYTVRILGKLTSFVNENANITSVSKLPESLERLKLGSRIRDNNLTSVPTILPPSITDLSYCFVRCKNFNQNISNWNTSNVTNMYYMFGEASAFNQPIGSWNTANVTTMDYMFYNIGSSPGAFDQNISNWNVSLIPTKPSQFDTNTPANWTTAEKPVWGTSGS
jgi:surface protein